MHLEIERKFLAHRDKLPPLTGGEHYIQGYMAEEPQVRYRMIGSRVVITIKRFITGAERVEFEFTRDDLTEKDRLVLKGLALWPPLEKTRYKFPIDGLVWELDVYEGRHAGLVTVEVEVPRLDHELKFPEWVDETAEVTGHPRYSNIALTRQTLNDTDKERVEGFRSFPL